MESILLSDVAVIIRAIVIAVPGPSGGLQESLLPSSCRRFVLLVDGEISPMIS